MNMKKVNSWEIRKLFEICQVETGRRPSKKELSQTKYFSLGGEHITEDHQINWEKNDWFITEEFWHSLKKGKLDEEAILLVKDGATIGKCAYFNLQRSKYITSVNEHVYKITSKPNICNNRFLYYVICSSVCQSQILNCVTGAAQPGLNRSFLQSVEIPLPNYKIQQKISAILSAYDDLIENNTRRIKILEEMAQRIYREWFVNFRFPGHEKVKFVNSELGKIPNGWSVENLYKYVDFEKGIEPGSDNYEKYANKENVPFLRVGDLGNRSIEIFVNRSLIKNKIIKEDDIAVSMDGSPGIVKMGLFGCYSTGIRKLVIKDNVMKKSFLYFLMMSEHIQNIIKTHSKGSTILHASESIKYMNFILPDNELMRIFDDIVKPMIKEILLLNNKNKILRETRDILLPKLISGELDVSDLDIAVRENKI